MRLDLGLHGGVRRTCLLAAFLLLNAASVFPATTNLYVTGFESSEGFSSTTPLAGQNGWLSFGSGGNGLISDPLFGPGQQAYIGFFAPTNADSILSLWRPINYTPSSSNSTVGFSVKMQIVDSTNNFYDDFRWSIYNRAGARLFTIDFDNGTLGIAYGLDDTNGFVSTGREFTNDVLHSLAVNIDFFQNRWNATLDGSFLASNKVSTVGAALDLGDMDAVWVLHNQRAGNNYMLFDDYSIKAGNGFLPFQLANAGKSGSGPFFLRLIGEPGRDYAIDASLELINWSAIRTNTAASDGTFDVVDAEAASLTRRFYRARLVR